MRDCEHRKYLKVVESGGSQSCKKFAKMIFVPNQSELKKFIVSILYFKDMSKILGLWIMMGTKKDDEIVVTAKEVKVMRFEPFINGLFYYAVETVRKNKSKKSHILLFFINSRI